MNQDTPETTPEAGQTIEPKPADPQQAEPQSLEPQRASTQPQDSRRRLRELLAIPERDRSDAQWDEMIELEIQLAPGNRPQEPRAAVGQRQEPGRRQDSGRRTDQTRRKEAGPGTPAKPFTKKPRRNTENRTKK